MGEENEGWRGFPHTGWQSVDAVRRRLDAGADPETGPWWATPLHSAVEFGTAEVVAEIAARVDDVDHLNGGRSALWRAVYEGKPEIAQALLAAGADPLRPMMSGWSPARLSRATRHVVPSGEVLTDEEETAVREAGRLVLALKEFPYYDGYSLACVAGIDAAEATRRLSAEVVPTAEVPPEVPTGDWWPAPFGEDTERTLSVTDVPGGCVLFQPWYFAVQTPEVMMPLSEGTVAYGMYANPKSGNQGNVHRDGRTIGWDLHPGGGADDRDGTREVLLAYLYAHKAVAYCCAYAGLRPKNSKAFTEPDQWIRLPGLSK
ncbi:ankyrin repeat domain-containing protein [Lentzea sp. NPDC051838]|uniref:ankyrin repeat domain-containing protein n=1 Tax=Lentzea sp. NPDC051838 TaxID=3154849 RepID=UPI003435E0F6